jgi:putative Mg2+ transporter-C (MgtC) family protein
MQMPLHLDWSDIALRLVLTIVAAGLIGLNREARGRAAGLRTTMLVCLAASIAMIQCNILLPLAGKGSDGFAVMDLMRLPLGILTGVGFIGGGAILKRDNLVVGVTTAATLWVTTVIGLCLGGGQLLLGSIGTAIVVIALWLLKWLDARIPKEHRAVIEVVGASSPSAVGINAMISSCGFSVRLLRQERLNDASITTTFEVVWTESEFAAEPSALLDLLRPHFDVHSYRLIDEAG